MIYAISIDWLAVYCIYHGEERWTGATPASNTLFDCYPWGYRSEDYGTRHFKRLVRVHIPNEEGGYDDYAEVQIEPHSRVIDDRGVIVRFVNRQLYKPDFWDLATRFLRENKFEFHSISRIDLCADFNQFATMSPRSLVEKFATKELRHVGRGVGALYFNHGISGGQYGVRYTGLSFGTHSSDLRVYLYNKSFELETQGDKPWIRDVWTSIGLDVRHVWRLEVSIKGKGTEFKDRDTGTKVVIDNKRLQSRSELSRLYFAFVRKLFSFVINRDGITNITREPRVELFNGEPSYDRGVIRNITASNRLDKMVIKALYTLGTTYRGSDNIELSDLAQSFAVDIAQSTDLSEWMKKRVDTWVNKIHR